MPDQPSDTPTPPGPDDQTTEINPATADAGPEPTTTISDPAVAEPKESWATKPLHVTRAVATGVAAGILLVGGVAGLAIGATLAGDDSDGPSPGRGWHGGDKSERGDRGGMPDRGQGDWQDQAPPGFGQGGPGYYGPGGPNSDDQTPDGDGPTPQDDGSTPTDPSDSST